MSPRRSDAVEVPYTDYAYVEASPDRMATVAALCGWKPAPLETARVLDLGCGPGGHLLPLASRAPRATFLGVDLLPVHVHEAERVAREAGLGNTRFVRESFFERPWADTRFDYVVAHGVASWMKPESRRMLFATIAEALAPEGVAYVSANILPGWYSKLAARDFLQWDLSATASPEESLRWLVRQVSPEQALYKAALETTLGRLAETDRAYGLHEFLAEEHHPETFTTLFHEARAAGLVYLGDATPASSHVELLSDEARARAISLDDPHAEQLIDFVNGTAFRRMLFVRADVAEAKMWTRPRSLEPARALGLFWLRRREKVRTRVMGLPAAIERACTLLEAAWPDAIAHVELASMCSCDPVELASELVSLWLSSDEMELRYEPTSLRSSPSVRPLADSVARVQASRGHAVTNAWHHTIILAQPLLAWILARLDGTRTAAELATVLQEDRRSASVNATETEAVVAAALSELARLALLVG